MTEKEINIVDQDGYIKDLEEENRLMLDQLHMVQEELERYYLRNKDLEKRLSQGGDVASPHVSHILPDDSVITELAKKVRQEEALVIQKELRLLDREQSPEGKIGHIFVDGVRRGASQWAILKELWALRRTWNNKTPPQAWGGESFSKLMEAFDKDGLPAVDDLIFGTSVSAFTCGNAYRAVAEYAKAAGNAKAAAEAAYRAFRVHPMPYRQKWLAWRLAEAGHPIKAHALLATLPEMSLSENDNRRKSEIEKHAMKVSLETARKQVGYQEQEHTIVAEQSRLRDAIRRLEEDIEAYQSEIGQLRDQRAHLEREHKAEMSDLRKTLADLQQRYASLENDHANHQRELGDQLSAAQQEMRKVLDGHTNERHALNQELSELRCKLTSLVASHAAERDRWRREIETSRQGSEQMAEEQMAERERLKLDLAEIKQCFSAGTLADFQHALENKIEHAHTSIIGQLESTAIEQSFLDSINKQVQAGFEEIKQHDSVNKLVDFQHALENKVEKASIKTIRQLESFITMQTYLESGSMLGEMQGWPISPDFGLCLVDILEQSDYDVILEFGSGISTLVVAKALKKKQLRMDSKRNIIHVAFDHLDEFFSKTKRLLKINQLDDKVNLQLANLIPYTDRDGQAYSYYNCRPAIRDLASQLDLQKSKVLLIIDGPPGATNKNARYPALPIILEFMYGAKIDIIMDDYRRAEEMEISKQWLRLLDDTGYGHASTELKLDKGALFIEAVPQVEEASARTINL